MLENKPWIFLPWWYLFFPPLPKTPWLSQPQDLDIIYPSSICWVHCRGQQEDPFGHRVWFRVGSKKHDRYSGTSNLLRFFFLTFPKWGWVLWSPESLKRGWDLLENRSTTGEGEGRGLQARMWYMLFLWSQVCPWILQLCYLCAVLRARGRGGMEWRLGSITSKPTIIQNKKSTYYLFLVSLISSPSMTVIIHHIDCTIYVAT